MMRAALVLVSVLVPLVLGEVNYVLVGATDASDAALFTTSRDGSSWENPVTIPFMSAVRDVAYCERRKSWIGAGKGSMGDPSQVAVYSLDAVVWKPAFGPRFLTDCRSLTYNEQMDIALISCVNTDMVSSGLAFSVDGGVKYQQLDNNYFKGSIVAIDMANHGDAFWVAVTDKRSGIAYSFDKGATWIDAVVPGGLPAPPTPTSVAYSQLYRCALLNCVVLLLLAHVRAVCL